MIFQVWDELNAEESCAHEIEADDAEEAAIRYAEEDVDGGIDGIYMHEGGPKPSLRDHGQPISVRAPNGVLSRFKVGVMEFEPIFGAEEIR
jgi:hypothetical protein